MIVIVCGGIRDFNQLTSTSKYDTHNDTWTSCQAMPQELAPYNSTVAVNDSVFVLLTDIFLSYDVTRNQWSKLNAPKVPASALVMKSGDLFALGGGSEKKAVQKYDITAGKWSVGDTQLPVEMWYDFAVILVSKIK